jgi:phasin
MADINPSADNVRAMLTETLGRLRKASEEYFGLLEKGLSSSPLPIADQAKQFCDFMQRNVTATFDLGDKLTQAKDMQDVLKMQSDFFQNQMRALTGYEPGRIRDEGSDRGLYPQKLSMLLPHGRGRSVSIDTNADPISTAFPTGKWTIVSRRAPRVPGRVR